LETDCENIFTLQFFPQFTI